ncbi:class I SAM-dependent methyltransferase [Aquimarina brevivitae]|uniref:Ubiquinone/menaquinone biosynthesis C-methylase UbiE n=1 Tax=Aquimarina brevivitae TaxID=323412 RepID=A0A4Q7PID4_9FLAO|nr:class I SAM-dependent methyltransferase [Aquimarina brevivitae]RZT00345.1 ubiquinone/menaquinone biosynthesis C-methylase UbiE [Aquimarina brevivitae]
MDYASKPEGYYDNIRYEMIKYLPKDASKIIDVGCGNGAFAAVLKEQTNAEVWGIEYMDREAQVAKEKLDKVYSGPCEDYIDELPDNYFDVIYFNDVLEHLVDPYEVLQKIQNKLAPQGVIISSIPNVRYHNTFMRLLLKKDWLYEDYGVMDRTHLRFFTNKSIRRMYEDLGYEVVTHEGINKSRSIRPYLYNLPVLFTQMDILFPQYATVAKRVVK